MVQNIAQGAMGVNAQFALGFAFFSSDELFHSVDGNSRDDDA